MNRTTRLPRALLLSTLALASACATTTPPAPTPAPPPATDGPAVQPPPFQQTPGAGDRAQADDARTATRRAIFDAAWRLVRDKHYDKTLGGADWLALRRQYEPLALAAPAEAGFYRTLNQMIGELGQSHMMVAGPGAEDEDAEELAASGGNAGAFEAAIQGVGDPGLTVRVIEGRPTVTAIRAGSSAERQGLLPGFVVTHIGGRELRASESKRALRPVEERFAIRRAAQRRLMGPVGSRVTIRFLDHDDRPGEVMVSRDAPATAPIRLGHLPPLYPEVRVSQMGDIGVLTFNIFLLQPVMEDIKKAMAGFRARGTRALIIDLRGNPGGQGAMAIPVAAQLIAAPLTLGSLQFREFTQVLAARPDSGGTFLGPIAILTDEGTASASEILAAGLQEAKRALIVGDATLGAVLPSVVEALPGGAVMQYVVADFKTPKGVMLEGRGVQPDRRVIETRAGLKTRRDPVLDAALVAVRASRPR